MSNLVKTEIIGASTVITFTQPEVRNPLSLAVLDELDAILDRYILTGPVIFTGSKGIFASGADLREILQLRASEAAEFSHKGQRLMDRISNLRVKTIAVINGPCYGGALDLALACDFRVGNANAAFCHPGAGLGIVTGWGGTQRLPRLIGQANALELFFTACPISAAEGARLGLLDEISDDPLSAALTF